MPYKSFEEINEMVEKDRAISESNAKISKYLTPWISGRNYFDGKRPPQKTYKSNAYFYHSILFNKEENND